MIFNSPFEDVVIPEDRTFTEFLFRNASGHLNKPALIDGPSGRTLTYAQLIGAIKKVAAGLYALGFKQGDVFAICSPNIPEYAVIFHAIASVGGIITTMNPLYTAEEIAHQVNDSKARFIITIPPFVEKANQAMNASTLEKVFVFGEAEGATPFAALMQNDGTLPDVTINPVEDLLVLPYSSGTTGLPKGVMLTHYNLIANICQCEGNIDFDDSDVMIGILPFFHIYGMLVVMSLVLNVGGTVVTMPQFDLEMFLKLIQEYKITRAALVPPIILALAKHPIVDNYDLSNLVQIFSGAAPLSGELQSAVAQRLNCLAVQGYGLTETSPVTHATPNDPDKVKTGSVGPSVANTEVQIVDVESREPLESGKEGEIWIRGPQVMKGYLNNPSATANMIDEDGWLHTGDIGYADEDGYLYVVDRLKELIKYKGFQVPPAELEGLLLTHESIADAAVIGVPDEVAGELPKGFVVLKPNHELSEEDVKAFVAEHVSPQKKLRLVEFVDQIPKSASGKILRRVLKQREIDGQ